MYFCTGTELECAVVEVYRPLATVADGIYKRLVILLFGGRSTSSLPAAAANER